MLVELNNRIKQNKTKAIALAVFGMVALTCLAFGLAINPAEAAINKYLNYQGKLLDSSKITVSDAAYRIDFRIYDQDAPGGSVLWSDSFDVDVEDGLFSVLLGSSGTLDLDFESNDGYWLSIEVEGDGEMTPRKEIGAAAYAFNSDLLDGLDTTTVGATASAVAAFNSYGNLTITGDPQGGAITQGSVYINPAAPGANETLLGIANNGSQRLLLDAEGDLTLGGYASMTDLFVEAASGAYINIEGSGSRLTSGAYLVGVNPGNISQSASTNVQFVLEDLSSAISSAGLWTDAAGYIYADPVGDYGSTGMRILDDGSLMSNADLVVDGLAGFNTATDSDNVLSVATSTAQDYGVHVTHSGGALFTNLDNPVVGAGLYSLANYAGGSYSNIPILGESTGVTTAGYNVGLYGRAFNSQAGNAGMFGVASSTSASAVSYGGFFSNRTTASNSNSVYGIYATTDVSGGDHTGTRYGTYSRGGQGATNYGVYAYGNSAGTTNYGLYAIAEESTTNYGLYATASGGATNWAGYFGGGNVYIQNNLYTSSSKLFLDSDTALSDTNNNDAGAYFVGTYDEFIYSDSTNVQDVLDDIDFTLDAVSSSAHLWTDGGLYTYLTATGDDMVVGASVSATADLWLDVSDQIMYLGGGATGTIATQSNTNLRLLPDGTGITVIGDAGHTSQGLDANDDLFVSGELEVDGTANFDAALNANNSLRVTPDGSGRMIFFDTVNGYYGVFHKGNDDGFRWAVGSSPDGRTNNNIIITASANYLKDHDHDTLSPDPTLFLHSSTDPDTNNTQWLSLSHDQTNAVLTAGTGAINLVGSNDTSDYMSFNGIDDQASQYFVSAGLTNYPGFRLNSTTDELEYRDEDSASWVTLDSLHIWTDRGTYIDPSDDHVADDVVIDTANNTFYVDVSANYIGVGTTPSYHFHVSQSRASNPVMYVENTYNASSSLRESSAITGISTGNRGDSNPYGVYGQVSAIRYVDRTGNYASAGVKGVATASGATNTPHAIGVMGRADGNRGIGVWGLQNDNSAHGAQTYGVFGYNRGTNNQAAGIGGYSVSGIAARFVDTYTNVNTELATVQVLAEQTDAKGLLAYSSEITTDYLVKGKINSTDDTTERYAGWFEVNGDQAIALELLGSTDYTSGDNKKGILTIDDNGLATNVTGISVNLDADTGGEGVWVYVEGDNSYGVYAIVENVQSPNTGVSYGGYFETQTDLGYAVYGYANDPTGINYGVYGITNSEDNGWAGYFTGNSTSTKVYIDSTLVFKPMPSAATTTEGSVYYDSDVDKYYGRTSSGWEELNGAAGLWTDSGTYIYATPVGDYGATGMRIYDNGEINTDSNLVVDGLAAFGTTTNTARIVNISASNSGGSGKYGLYSSISGSSSGGNFSISGVATGAVGNTGELQGVSGSATGIATGNPAYGGYFYSDAQATNAIGVHAQGSALSGATNAYGVYALGEGTTGDTVYGLYATTGGPPGGTKWAGYFDSGNVKVVNSFYVSSTSAFSNYLTLSRAADNQPILYFASSTYTYNPGFRLASSTGQLEYRDQGSSSWSPFDDFLTSGSILWEDRGVYIEPNTATGNFKIADITGHTAIGSTATTSADWVLGLGKTYSGGAASGIDGGASTTVRFTGTVNGTYYLIGMGADVRWNGTPDAGGTELVLGASGQTIIEGTGGGSLDDVRALFGYSKVEGGTVASNIAVSASAERTGGTVTNSYGLKSRAADATTNYGVYSEAANGTTNYAFYSPDGGGYSYFGDHVAIEDASADSHHALNITETYDNGFSGTETGVNADITYNGAPSGAYTVAGYKALVAYTGNGAAGDQEAIGADLGVYLNSNANTIESTYGAKSQNYNYDGTINTAYGYYSKIAATTALGGTPSIGTTYGIYIDSASGTSNYGVYATVEGASSGNNYGLRTLTTGDPGNTGYLYGVLSQVSGEIYSPNKISYGGYFNSNATASSSIAVYASATNGTDANWAGYFANGDVYSADDLYVGATSPTLSNGGFSLDGNDLFVAGMAGIEGNVYTDGQFIAGSTMAMGDGYVSSSGNISFYPDYMDPGAEYGFTYFSRGAANDSRLYWGYPAAGNASGIRQNPSTFELEYRDENSATWVSFDNLTNLWTDQGTYIDPDNATGEFRINDSDGHLAIGGGAVSPSTTLALAETWSANVADDTESFYGVKNEITHTGDTGVNNLYLYGDYNYVTYNGAAGAGNEAFNGTYNVVLANNTGGTVNDAYAGFFSSGKEVGAGGTVDNMYSVYAYTAPSIGTTNNAYGVYSTASGGSANYAFYSPNAGGDAAFLDDVWVGATTATLSNGSFSMGGDDLFVAGMAGIEGNVYTDGYFIASSTIALGEAASVGGFVSSSNYLSLIAHNYSTDYIYLDSSDGAGDQKLLWTEPNDNTPAGFRYNSSTAQMEYRDDGLSSWTPFDDFAASGDILWTDRGDYIDSNNATGNFKIADITGFTAVGSVATTTSDWVFASGYNFSGASTGAKGAASSTAIFSGAAGGELDIYGGRFESLWNGTPGAGNQRIYGVKSIARKVDFDTLIEGSYGLSSESLIESGTSTNSMGIYARSYPSGDASITNSYGAYAMAYDSGTLQSLYNYGIYGYAYGGGAQYGVYAKAEGTDAGAVNVGTYVQTRGSGSINYGLIADVQDGDEQYGVYSIPVGGAGDTTYGIYSDAQGGDTSYDIYVPNDDDGSAIYFGERTAIKDAAIDNNFTLGVMEVDSTAGASGIIGAVSSTYIFTGSSAAPYLYVGALSFTGVWNGEASGATDAVIGAYGSAKAAATTAGTLEALYGFYGSAQAQGTSSVGNTYGIYAVSDNLSDSTNAWGGYFRANGFTDAGYGVQAEATADGTEMYGGHFKANGDGSDQTVGVYGESNSTGGDGFGAYGYAHGAADNNYGVFSNVSGGTATNYGFYGAVSGSTGNTGTVYGMSLTTSGGVYSPGSASYGGRIVQNANASTTYGLYIDSNDTDGVDYGLYVDSDGTDSADRGIYVTSGRMALRALNSTESGIEARLAHVYAIGSAREAVYGNIAQSGGAYSIYGVTGSVNGSGGYSGTMKGVNATASGATYAVGSNAYAGYFAGTATASTTYGVYATASNGTTADYGVYGEASDAGMKAGNTVNTEMETELNKRIAGATPYNYGVYVSEDDTAEGTAYTRGVYSYLNKSHGLHWAGWFDTEGYGGRAIYAETTGSANNPADIYAVESLADGVVYATDSAAYAGYFHTNATASTTYAVYADADGASGINYAFYAPDDGDNYSYFGDHVGIEDATPNDTAVLYISETYTGTGNANVYGIRNRVVQNTNDDSALDVHGVYNEMNNWGAGVEKVFGTNNYIDYDEYIAATTRLYGTQNYLKMAAGGGGGTGFELTGEYTYIDITDSTNNQSAIYGNNINVYSDGSAGDPSVVYGVKVDFEASGAGVGSGNWYGLYVDYNLTTSGNKYGLYLEGTDNQAFIGGDLSVGGAGGADNDTIYFDAGIEWIRYDEEISNKFEISNDLGIGEESNTVDHYLYFNQEDEYLMWDYTGNAATDEFVLSDSLSIGGDSAIDDDYLYFDQEVEWLVWDDSATRFEISDELVIHNAIKVGDASAATSAWNIFGSGTRSHSTHISSVEDVYFSDDVEIDGDLYWDGHTGRTTSTFTDKYKLYVDTAGIVYRTTSTGADYAEYFWNDGFSNVEAGDILIASTASSTANTVTISSHAYDPLIVGVYSTEPADGISSGDTPVALIGRVPVKINSSNGNIQVGDPITSSPTPGVGMKATKPGMIVGWALEPYSNSSSTEISTVTIFAKAGWHSGRSIDNDGNQSTLNDNFAFEPSGSATSSTPAVSSFGLTFRASGWDAASSTERILGMTIKNDVSSTDEFGLSFYNNDDDKVAFISNSGDLMLGNKLYPSDRGVMQDDYYIFLNSAGPGGKPYMMTNAAGWSTGSYDFAEMFPSDQLLQAGEIVTIGSADESVVRSASAYQTSIAGIVSTEPGFIAGDFTTSTYPIALAGRVPTKVTNAGGAIAIGDPITTSDIPGVGMKAASAGPIVGYALEASDAISDEIIVYVNPGWYGGGAASALPGATGDASGFDPATSGEVTYLSGALDMQGNDIYGVNRIYGNGYKWEIDENGVAVSQVSTAGGDKPVYGITANKAEIIISGSGTTENGKATIEFTDAVANMFDSANLNIKVIVTPTSADTPGLAVTNKSSAGFTVEELNSGDGNISFDWIFMAPRTGYEVELDDYLINSSAPDSATSTDPISDGSGSTTTDPISDGSGSTSTDPISDGSGSTSTDPISDGSGSTTTDPVTP